MRDREEAESGVDNAEIVTNPVFETKVEEEKTTVEEDSEKE